MPFVLVLSSGYISNLFIPLLAIFLFIYSVKSFLMLKHLKAGFLLSVLLKNFSNGTSGKGIKINSPFCGIIQRLYIAVNGCLLLELLVS